MPAWKKRRKKRVKIAPILSQKYFQVSRERYVFKEHSRIRIATIYIHHIYPHTCTSWFDYMTQLSLDPRFDFIIYALQVCPSFLPTYDLHISLSCRKKGITSQLPWWGSTNTIYFERLESVIQWNLWVLFWKIIKTLEQ